ncbi:hypothetical protein [Streptomyces thermocarboxydus]|uniref:hypothetical protein n=1 Tax=Streptomyces thermocarboxydus TaxID=59299 RepID=UPI003B5059C1
MAELLGRVAAVAALGHVPAHVGQELAAPADGHVEQPVVEAALLRGRQLLVGADQSLAELVAGLVEGAGREVDVRAEQSGGHGYRLGLDLDVPEQAAGERGQGPVRPLGEGAVLRRHRRRRAHAPSARRLQQPRQHLGHTVVGGPLADRVPHSHEEDGTEGHGGLAEGDPVEHTVQGGPGDHGGGPPAGGEAHGGVVVHRVPVARRQQGDGTRGFRLRTSPQPRGQRLVGLPGITARRGIGRTRGVGGVH